MHPGWRVLVPGLDIIVQPIEYLVHIVLHFSVLAYGHFTQIDQNDPRSLGIGSLELSQR